MGYLSGMQQQEYDVSPEFERDVRPLLERLVEICEELGVPIFAQFVTAARPSQDGTGEEMKMTTIGHSRHGGWVPMIFIVYKMVYDEPELLGEILNFIMGKKVEKSLSGSGKSPGQRILEALQKRVETLDLSDLLDSAEAAQEEDTREGTEQEKIPESFEDFLKGLGIS